MPMKDTWENIGNLTNLAMSPAYDYTESFGFAIASSEGSAFQVTQDAVNFDVLAPYPNMDVVEAGDGLVGLGSGDGCLVILDDQNVFLAGGIIANNSFSPRAFLYNRDCDEWFELASMPQGRKLHSCGVVDSVDGYQVIVAGTEAQYSPGDTSPFTVDVYDILSDSWIPGEIS